MWRVDLHSLVLYYSHYRSGMSVMSLGTNYFEMRIVGSLKHPMSALPHPLTFVPLAYLTSL